MIGEFAIEGLSLVNKNPLPSPFFVSADSKGFKARDFVSADSKSVTGAFFGTADSKRVRAEKLPMDELPRT